MTVQTNPKMAPDFSLSDEVGKMVRLADRLGTGPVLLLFYRGDWCSYCNAQLAAYAVRHDELESLGAAVLAISVDRPADAASLKTKLQFPFPVLSDPDHAVIDMYAGLEPQVRQGIAIGKPATYVLDSGGRIQWSYVGEDFADRPLVDEVMDQIRRVAEDA